MKKKKFNKKLSLNKEKISNLDNIKGGSELTVRPNCFTQHPEHCGCTAICRTAECFIEI